MYIHVHHTYIHDDIFIYACISHTYMYVCMYVHVHVHVCTMYMYMYMYVCMYDVCMYMYAYQWPVFKDELIGVFGDFLAFPAPPSPHSYPVIAKI